MHLVVKKSHFSAFDFNNNKKRKHMFLLLIFYVDDLFVRLEIASSSF